MTTTLKAQLRTDLTTAMKARDELRSATIRMTLAAITNEEVAGKVARELSDDEVLKVIGRELKKRKEAAEAFAGAGRAEQAAREEAEGEVLTPTCPRSCPTRSCRCWWTRRWPRPVPRGRGGWALS
jgi:uncharacterized protein YqeY